MSSLSQHLGLILNDESDPFKRTDFTSNWGQLDQYPGTYICTSTTRPTWTSNQAGMQVFETDTRRTVMWSGTGWHEVQGAPVGFYGAITPNVTLSGNQSVSYTVMTFTSKRPGTLIVWMQTELHTQGSRPFGLNVFPYIDGANSSIFSGSGGAYVQLATPNSAANPSLWNDYAVHNCMGVRAISAGTHTISGSFNCPSGFSASAGYVSNVAVYAQLVNTSDV